MEESLRRNELKVQAESMQQWGFRPWVAGEPVPNMQMQMQPQNVYGGGRMTPGASGNKV